MDLVFLVDCSKNITPQKFRKVQSLLYDFVDSFHVDQDQVRIGLIQYCSDIQVDLTLDTCSNVTQIKLAIENMQQQDGSTETKLALDFLLTFGFTKAAGSRAHAGVPQAGVLITKNQYNIENDEDMIKHGVKIIQIQPTSREHMNIAEISSAFCSLAQDSKQNTYQGTLADIVFLVDGSYSISPQEFTWIKNFLFVVVGRFYISKIQFGLVLYAERPKIQFLLEHYSEKTGIQTHIWKLKRINGTKTMTGRGLGKLLKQQFIETAGSRISEGVPQIG
ncbi:hypothetical protein Z043_123664, partial [Scleropages formosus]